MHISAAELETTVVKAVVGAGVTFGVANEIGRAALALSRQGMDAPTIIATALDKIDQKDAGTFVIEKARAGTFVPINGYLSAILAGPSICDLLASAQATITARFLDVPALVVAQLAARQLNAVADHKAGDFPSIYCANGQFAIAGNRISAWCRTADIEFSAHAPEESVDERQIHHAIDVDTIGWRRINEFAGRCLVPGSEESRLQDAGAGLVDED